MSGTQRVIEQVAVMLDGQEAQASKARAILAGRRQIAEMVDDVNAAYARMRSLGLLEYAGLRSGETVLAAEVSDFADGTMHMFDVRVIPDQSENYLAVLLENGVIVEPLDDGIPVNA